MHNDRALEHTSWDQLCNSRERFTNDRQQHHRGTGRLELATFQTASTKVGNVWLASRTALLYKVLSSSPDAHPWVICVLAAAPNGCTHMVGRVVTLLHPLSVPWLPVIPIYVTIAHSHGAMAVFCLRREFRAVVVTSLHPAVSEFISVDLD